MVPYKFSSKKCSKLIIRFCTGAADGCLKPVDPDVCTQPERPKKSCPNRLSQLKRCMDENHFYIRPILKPFLNRLANSSFTQIMYGLIRIEVGQPQIAE